jgi:hypothetical protein
MALAAALPLLLGVAPGCKKDEPPKPDPAATEAATANSSAHPPMRRPHAGFNRPDPQVTKDYRVDVCYYGTLSLRQARDAYLASLGKDEPSAKKIPSFGVAGSSPTPATAAPASTAAGKPAAPPKPSASPVASSASAAPAGSASPMNLPDRSHEYLMRLPHERNARSCSSAVPLKEPAMGDVDVQIAAFAPFVVDLAKDFATAQQYYQREEYTKDNFAKGKELDKKLREGFAKLDEMSDKLGGAIDAWRKAHPADTSKMDEGEKVTRALIDDGRDVLLAVAHKKAEGDAWKAALDKLDKSVAAFKTYADAHAADNWSRIFAGPVEVFMKTVKGGKVGADKSFDSDSYLQLVTGYVGLLDSRQRAIARAARPMLPTGDAPQPAPVPAPAEPPK